MTGRKNEHIEERRIAQRHDVSLPVDCRVPATQQRATVRNISITGMKLQTQGKLLVGQTVIAMFDEGREVAGTVVWADTHLAGIRFAGAISVDLVAVLAGSEVQVTAT